MADQKELLKGLEDNQKLVLQLQKNIDQLKASFSEKIAKEDERSITFNKAIAENFDLKAELELKSRRLLDNEAELNVLRGKLTPVVEENKSLARANANLMKELSILKQGLEEKEKQLHDKDSHFNLIIENARNDAQKKLKDAIDMDARTILALRSEIEKLKVELEKRDALLREREVKEKELMIDVVARFKELVEERPVANGNLKEILPIVDAAIKHGDSIDKIKESLKRLGYKNDYIERAIVLIRKGI